MLLTGVFEEALCERLAVAVGSKQKQNIIHVQHKQSYGINALLYHCITALQQKRPKSTSVSFEPYAAKFYGYQIFIFIFAAAFST